MTPLSLGVSVDHVAGARNARVVGPVRVALIPIDAFLRFLHKRPNSLLFLSLFLILVGSRAAVINHAGNSSPFWDEWEGGWAEFARPYIQGNLTVGDLFAAHNEHVIFFTRLMTLLIFKISGYWDVILQMIANAILDAATVVAISARFREGFAGVGRRRDDCIDPDQRPSHGLGKHIARVQHALLFVAGVLVCESVVSGRQPGVVAAMGGRKPVRGRLVSLHGVGRADARRGDRPASRADRVRSQGGIREWLGIGVCAAATAALVRLVPHAQASDAYRAHSLGQFAGGFFQFASWPARPLGLVIGLPSLIFCVVTFADRPALSDPRWFNVGAYGWLLTQLLALAAGRAEIGVQSRYSDTLLIGLAINLTSVFWLSGSRASGAKGKIWPYLGLAAMAGRRGFVVGACGAPRRAIWRTGGRSRGRGKNVRDYLATGDASASCAAPRSWKSHIESNRLRELLDAPDIRSALPPELLSRDKPDNWVEAFKRTFLEPGLHCSGPALSCSSPSSLGKGARSQGRQISRARPLLRPPESVY